MTKPIQLLHPGCQAEMEFQDLVLTPSRTSLQSGRSGDVCSITSLLQCKSSTQTSMNLDSTSQPVETVSQVQLDELNSVLGIDTGFST